MATDGKAWTEEELNELSYNDIRKMCKANGLKAAGKKVDLLESLVKKLVHGPSTTADDEKPREKSVGDEKTVDQSMEDLDSPKKAAEEAADEKPADRKEVSDSPPAAPTDEKPAAEAPAEESPAEAPEAAKEDEPVQVKQPESIAEPTVEPVEEVEILVQRTTVVQETVLNTTITLDDSTLPAEVVNLTDDQTASTVPRGGGLDETRDLDEKPADPPAEAEVGQITDDEEDVPKVEAAGAAPADPDGIPELNADELMDVDDQSTVDSLLPANETFRVEEPLNSTYTKSDSNSQEGSPEEPTAEMSADESRPASGLGTAEERPLLESAPRVEVARVDHDRMDYPENSPPVVLTTPLASSTAGQSKIPRWQGPTASSSSDRFAAAHRELFEKMPSIEETLSAKKERQQNLLTGNERINRLATPKQQTPPRRRAETPGSSKPANVFEFQATHAGSEPPAPRKLFTPRKPQEDVKALTKRSQKENVRAQSVIPATIPDCSERINQLATPKGADRAVSIPRERRVFTPKTGRFEYTDTTKMSDAEFAMYMKRERQQDLHQKRRQW